MNGSVRSSSGSYSTSYGNGGFGSGGAIRFVSPIVNGHGSLDVTGGVNTYNTSYGGGAGRIRIDSMDRRSLALTFNPSSAASIGGNMVAIPANPPRLDITQVAGTNITVGAASPVFFILPQGSDTNQTINVQASNFGSIVPIRVVLTPDNGPSSSYETQIDNSTINPASVTVPVVIPVNVQVQVNAWTR